MSHGCYYLISSLTPINQASKTSEQNGCELVIIAYRQKRCNAAKLIKFHE